MIEKLLRLPEVESLTGYKRSTIYLRVSAGLFPRQIRLGARAVAWSGSEIAAMNAARIRGASDEEIRALVHDLEAARKRAA